jgi:hypothetical protein
MGVGETQAGETGARIEVILEAGFPGNAEEDLRSLLRWLRADENVAGRTYGRVGGSTPPQPDTMGTAFDIVQLTLGSGLSAGSLVVSLLQWRDARRHPPGITLRRGGMTVEIPSTADVDAGALIRAVAFLTAQPLPDDLSTADGSSAADRPAGVPPTESPVAVPSSADAAHTAEVRAEPGMALACAVRETEAEVGTSPAATVQAATVRTGEAIGDGTPS